MNGQGRLFSAGGGPLARRQDVDASQEPARAGAPSRARVLDLVRRHRDSTATELARIAGEVGLRVIHSRLSELLADGEIEREARRRCSVTSHHAWTYRATSFPDRSHS
ncbi:MAG: hypothetical protein DRQ55_16510 [Planctomycetota bacterium]|nr:MAG: hypothetical protein DRQ55_16510 [Planctomycetota bacterium]RLA43820.1 MAG: hypothetical protein DRQ97_12260 [Gammaproteobacteria bacterium]